MTETTPVSIRMPVALKERLADLAYRRRVPLSTLLVQLAEAELRKDEEEL